jgi:hypothetical protein
MIGASGVRGASVSSLSPPLGEIFQDRRVGQLIAVAGLCQPGQHDLHAGQLADLAVDLGDALDGERLDLGVLPVRVLP